MDFKELHKICLERFTPENLFDQLKVNRRNFKWDIDNHGCLQYIIYKDYDVYIGLLYYERFDQFEFLVKLGYYAKTKVDIHRLDLIGLESLVPVVNYLFGEIKFFFDNEHSADIYMTEWDPNIGISGQLV